MAYLLINLPAPGKLDYKKYNYSKAHHKQDNHHNLRGCDFSKLSILNAFFSFFVFCEIFHFHPLSYPCINLLVKKVMPAISSAKTTTHNNILKSTSMSAFLFFKSLFIIF